MFAFVASQNPLLGMGLVCRRTYRFSAAHWSNIGLQYGKKGSMSEEGQKQKRLALFFFFFDQDLCERGILWITSEFAGSAHGIKVGAAGQSRTLEL